MFNNTLRQAEGKDLKALEQALSAFRIVKAIRLNGVWTVFYG